MKRLFPLVGFLVFTLSSPSIAQHPAASGASTLSTESFCSGAVQPPVEIGLEISQISDADNERGTAELTLSLTPMVESTRISWEVKIPSELSSLSGNLQGVEEVSLGDQATKTLLLSVPDGKRYHLYARAIIETEAGETFSRAVSRYVDFGAPDIAHPPFVRHDSVRGNVTSYKGVQLEGGAR